MIAERAADLIRATTTSPNQAERTRPGRFVAGGNIPAASPADHAV